LKVSTNVKIAMQCFENFGGGKCTKCPPGCAPGRGQVNDLKHKPANKDVIFVKLKVLLPFLWCHQGDKFWQK